MNSLPSILAAAALLSFTSSAAAGFAPPVRPGAVAVADLAGPIQSVDLEQKTFSVTVDGREVALSYHEKTAFLLDGKPSSAERVLIVGRTVSVKHEANAANTVEARSKP